jgi:uncharacterized cofD-like protein
MKKITVLGGGTGSYVVLRSLRQIPSLDIAAIVTMMDSGGSTGKLRDQLRVLPPGDLRQCLVALSEAPEIWRKLFTYRFENGDLKGHNFGNIFISTLEKIAKDYDEVLDEAHYVMQCIGRVYPAILSSANIQVRYDTGRIVESEKLLDELNPDHGHVIEAKAIPSVHANPKAIERINESEYIIAGPGDLYSSVISVALAEGIAEAYSHSNGKLIYIMNLMTKASQTHGYTAYQHLSDFSKYYRRLPDVCIVNTMPIAKEMLTKYEEVGEEPVVNDLNEKGYKGKIIMADLVDTSQHVDPNGHLSATYAHSIVRHDESKLKDVLEKVIKTV